MTESSRPAVVIDCDPGHDDALAILLAARHLDVRAVTAVHGNAPLDRTHANARRVLELAGRTDIPVAAGCDRPLVREAHFAPDVHGKTGLDGPDLPEPTTPLMDAHAVDVLIQLSRSVPDLEVFAVGPLTNIAMAIRRDPGFASRVKRFRIMGGSLTFGNVTPAAEFNIWADPDAAHIVFGAGTPITMVGLNVTMQSLATPDRRAQLRSVGRRTAVAFADMLDFYAHGEGQYSGLDGGALHDPMAVATLIDPTLVTTTPLNVQVETSRGSVAYGMTLCDGRGLDCDLRPRGPYSQGGVTTPNADVATHVDDARFWDLLFEAIASYE
jgi:inosine-uridine nucleoside N-ribohydrolase